MEERVDQSRKRALLSAPLLHAREVPVRAPFLLVAEEPLRLEIAQDGEHRGVGELRAEPALDLAHRSRAVRPEHRHHVELTFAERPIVCHGVLWNSRCYYGDSSNAASRAACQLC